MIRIRSFISIPLPREIQKSIAGFIQRIAQEEDGIRWVPDDNLHLTLKHLGDVDNVEVPKICGVIREIVSEIEPFELIFSDAGAFPSTDRPRTIYAGIQDPTGSLCRLVESLELEMAELGFKREPRDYRPHLPIGRVKGSRKRASEVVFQRLSEQRDLNFGEMMVDQMEMIGSFLEKQGPSYQVMDSIDF